MPAVADGAAALGSDLPLPDDTVDCRGEDPQASSPTCSIAQIDLAGSKVVVPEDGEIVGWTVRGARGELALDVIRPRGEDTIRVARSQWESVSNEAPSRFPTSLPVERGDVIGVELGQGGAIGVTDTEGATTNRWLAPTGGAYGKPDFDEGTGFDLQVLVRAEFVAGATPKPPPQLTGAEALNAPDGRVRKESPVESSQPGVTARVELVEVRGKVALDLIRDGRRTARTFLPDLVAGGDPIDLSIYDYPDQGVSEAGVSWVNPSSGRSIFHFLRISGPRAQVHRLVAWRTSGNKTSPLRTWPSCSALKAAAGRSCSTGTPLALSASCRSGGIASASAAMRVTSFRSPGTRRCRVCMRCSSDSGGPGP